MGDPPGDPLTDGDRHDPTLGADPAHGGRVVVYGSGMRTSTWYRRSLTAMLASGLLFGLGACSDDSGDDGDDTSGAEDDGAGEGDDGGEDDGDDGSSSSGGITIAGFEFEGATVAAGATVAVTNEDSTTHTVTSEDDLFDVSVSGGESGELTAPSEPGSYAYRCAIHSSMQGTLVVE